jgi:hypothetical protein
MLLCTVKPGRSPSNKTRENKRDKKRENWRFKRMHLVSPLEIYTIFLAMLTLL